MTNLGRAGLILVLAVLANTTTALAQSRSGYRSGRYFDRVTTGQRSSATLSSRGTRVARSSGISQAVSRTSHTTTELHPYSAEVTNTQASSGSSGEQQPIHSPPPQMVPRTQSHNYYPDRRAGLTVQPPLTLTTKPFTYPGCLGTASRSPAAGSAGGHHR